MIISQCLCADLVLFCYQTNNVGDLCFVKSDKEDEKIDSWKVVKELIPGHYNITRKSDFLLLHRTKFMQAL